MKTIISLCLFAMSFPLLAAPRPARYVELLPYVQAAPDQGESNTCWFVASTGAMELLLNKKYKVRAPKANGKYDLSESFLIWQKDFYDAENPAMHFIEDVVKRFNHGEAILNKVWPFKAYYEDGTDSYEGWNKHPNFYELPRIKVPQIKTELLFSRGKRHSMDVLDEADLELMKVKLSQTKSPLIVNYNDDSYWHVVLIVGYDDNRQGDCYEIEKADCKKGSFYVRDSNGKRWDRRSYSWFLQKGNAASVIQFK